MPDLEAIRAAGLLAPGRPVLVLLSGGRDSVCLLDVARRIAGVDSVRALHVQYGLRADADRDEALCGDVCERLGVALEIERAPAPPATGNVQAWARDLRYAAAARRAQDDGADVAAAHTADDQVETVLYRLAASPGRRALLGMPARAGSVVRPLLDCTRADTTAWCREHGLPWVDDPTNASPRYARNRVRHGLLEALREIHPAAAANVLATLAILRDEAAVLDAEVARARTDDVAALRTLAPALRRLLLGPRADEILALESGSLDLGQGRRAVVEQGRVRFAAGPATEPPADVSLAVPGVAAFGAGEVEARCGAFEPGEGILDAEELGTDVQVRAWRAGDRMRPLGLGGSKSLQDLFTDRRVPRESRRTLPVVCARGEIAWVPGLAVGERFRVSAGARAQVKLTWRT